MCALRPCPGEGPHPSRVGAEPTAPRACISGAPANDNGALPTRHRIDGRDVALLALDRLLLGAAGIALIAAGACLLGAGE